MADRVALITGGAKGIGRGIALDLAAQQWSVAICYRTSEVEARTTADAITSRGGRALSIRCDVSDPQAARDLAAQVEQQWGRIDALINGAGPYHRVNLFDETVEGWNEMFDGNLHPIFYLAKAVSTGMKARKSGRIVNFSMANADQMISQPNVTAHYIAKAGVLILTRTLAKLLAPHGITVNAVCPGYVLTPLVEHQIPEQAKARGISEEEVVRTVLLAAQPTKRFVTVAEISGLVSFLCGDDAKSITGAMLPIDGGWTAE